MGTTRDHLSVRAYGPSPGSHSHDHAQLLVGLQGRLALEIEGRGARVGAGDAVLVAPGQRHDFEGERGGSVCLVLDSAHPLWSRLPPHPHNLGRCARSPATLRKP